MTYRLLDLFCGAGGAAMGYHRAGFEVVGVDIKPQPHYPFEFHQADALEYCREHGAEFDAIHASPPCQGYSRFRHLPWLRGKTYPMLIGETREALKKTGKPYVIENVSDAPIWGAELCGTALGLSISRHRRFESNVMLLFSPCAGHPTIESGRASLSKRYAKGRNAGVTGVFREISRSSIAGHFSGVDFARKALGIEWMAQSELTQAIPPAYTEFIGKQLIAYLDRA